MSLHEYVDPDDTTTPPSGPLPDEGVAAEGLYVAGSHLVPNDILMECDPNHAWGHIRAGVDEDMGVFMRLKRGKGLVEALWEEKAEAWAASRARTARRIMLVLENLLATSDASEDLIAK